MSPEKLSRKHNIIIFCAHNNYWLWILTNNKQKPACSSESNSYDYIDKYLSMLLSSLCHVMFFLFLKYVSSFPTYYFLISFSSFLTFFLFFVRDDMISVEQCSCILSFLTRLIPPSLTHKWAEVSIHMDIISSFKCLPLFFQLFLGVV